jgi:hypothetical protein
MNLVEVFFAIITRQAIRRGSFRSVRDLTDAIRRFIDAWNEHCQPFVWTKTADPRQSEPSSRTRYGPLGLRTCVRGQLRQLDLRHPQQGTDGLGWDAQRLADGLVVQAPITKAQGLGMGLWKSSQCLLAVHVGDDTGGLLWLS